jgi:Peptidase family M28
MRLATLLALGASAAAALVALAGWYALVVPGRGHSGPLPPLTDAERDLAYRLKDHVDAIASVPHNIKHYAALEMAAQHIEHTMETLGYSVNREVFSVGGREVRNIEVQREESSGASMVVVGAHYDSYGDAPGANDNGTGVAAILELARLLKDWQPRNIRLRLVLFVNEEPPYYRTQDMGSWRYAKGLSERGEKVHGMISLETLGAFSDVPGSQKYPKPLSLALPSTANFIAFVGLPGSRAFHHEVMASFRTHTEFPSMGAVIPDAVAPGAGWSDHWSFQMFGYPAMMITDTALFRYPHYHLPSDTPDKVDYQRLARITKGLERVLRELAPEK